MEQVQDSYKEHFAGFHKGLFNTLKDQCSECFAESTRLQKFKNLMDDHHFVHTMNPDA